MTRQATRGRRIIIAAFIVGLIPILAWLTVALWDRLCGNQHFSFYGRIVDDQGRGIFGVNVEAQLLYSDAIAQPTMFGRPERMRKLLTVTDKEGNYQFRGITGYSISIRSVSKAGFKLLDATGPPYSPSTWSSDDKSSWSTLPDDPTRPYVSAYKLIDRNLLEQSR